mmetsp:Transcript_119020/g.341973  ORF Transcript_119020/g.341973 Transcript_119020/m.341973 type:complete len:257 (-) Transcript_119020:1880-2650(-)
MVDVRASLDQRRHGAAHGVRSGPRIGDHHVQRGWVVSRRGACVLVSIGFLVLCIRVRAMGQGLADEVQREVALVVVCLSQLLQQSSSRRGLLPALELRAEATPECLFDAQLRKLRPAAAPQCNDRVDIDELLDREAAAAHATAAACNAIFPACRQQGLNGLDCAFLDPDPQRQPPRARAMQHRAQGVLDQVPPRRVRQCLRLLQDVGDEGHRAAAEFHDSRDIPVLQRGEQRRAGLVNLGVYICPRFDQDRSCRTQ